MGKRFDGGTRATRPLTATAAALVVGFGSVASGAGSPETRPIRLTVSETAAAVTFAGTCQLIGPDGGRNDVPIEGEGPVSYEFAATALRCELTATGRLTVTVERGGSRSRVTTSGGRITVNMS